MLRPLSFSRREAHLYLHDLEKRYGNISQFRFGPFDVVFLSHPDYIEHMLLNRDIYVKVEEGGMLRHLLGKGLLTSEGDFWLKQRRLIQPIFHKQRLNNFVQQIADATNEMLDGWETHPSSEPLDVYSEMNKVTLDIVGRTMFSTNVKSEFDKVNKAITRMLSAVRDRSRMLRFPLWFPLPSHIRIQRNLQILDDTIQDIINTRRNEKGNFDDLLTMLMDVEDADTAERMTDKQLRDEVLTIFIAGHETTANALAYMLYLLAKNPEAKQKVQVELDALLNPADMTFESLQKLTYTTMVIKEAMRLYPPAWIIVREAATDDIIDGYLVKKGHKVFASPYAMQHSERYWDKPEEFHPERFSPENMKDKPRYAYFPFGGGARLCVGNNFAMMEMQILLALICSRFDFSLPANYKMELTPLITLRPKHGVPLKLVKRG